MNLSDMNDKHITIIGSGFAGLCMAAQLIRHGHKNFQIIEKMDDLGGTWRDNTYPGCACDVPSHLYSFSFETRSEWSTTFPTRDEIFAYISSIGIKYGLYDKTRFNSEITSARFNETSNKWILTDQNGVTSETDIIVSGLGQLNRPKIPTIAGHDSFTGPIFHSARWEHQHEFEGKRIGIIGNGPSAAQFIPEMAKISEQMTVFQRSPCHVVPRNNKPYSAFQKVLFKYVPGLRRFYRGLIFWSLEVSFLSFNEIKKPPFLVRLLSLSGSLGDRINEQFDTQVKDPKMREILKPDYTIGCKRVVISDEYYPALLRDNVHVETQHIDQITPNGIRTKDGKEHKFDIIIYGTGFESTDFLAPMEIEGRNKQSLNTAWRDGAEAYLGITLPDFPNLFILYGPNTNLGTNSIIFMIESQVNYVLGAIAALGNKKATTLEIKKSSMAGFADYLKARLSTSVWARDCDSWYKNEAGKITNNWPDFPHEYSEKTAKFDDEAYHFETGKTSPAAVAGE